MLPFNIKCSHEIACLFTVFKGGAVNHDPSFHAASRIFFIV